MKQHAVPENIMDVEFKLFGSLTAKQFGYILGGALVALLLFYMFKGLGSSFLGWIFAVLSVILGLSLALIRINEQPFEVWLGNFLVAMFSSQKRVWKKQKKELPPLVSNTKTLNIPPNQAVSQFSGQPSLQTSGPSRTGTPLGTPVVPTVPGASPTLPVGANQKSSVTEPQAANTNSSIPVVRPIANPLTLGDSFRAPGSFQKGVSSMTNQTPNRPLTVQSLRPSIASTGTDSVKPKETTPSLSALYTQEPPKVPVAPSNAVQAGSEALGVGQQPQVPQNIGPKTMQSYTNKALQYGDLIPQKESKTANIVTENVQPSVQAQGVTQGADFQDENKVLREKVAEYIRQNSLLQKDLSDIRTNFEMLSEQNKQLTTAVSELKRQPVQVPKTQSVGFGGSMQGVNKPPISRPKEPTVYNGPYLTKKPNVISGIVHTTDGSLLPGVVVIVKNEQGRPVRAMKTNSLGQFITTTALDNGVYTIELSKEEYSFGRFEMKLDGNIVPTYDFTAA